MPTPPGAAHTTTTTTKGKKRATDTTNPEEIGIIARRVPRGWLRNPKGEYYRKVSKPTCEAMAAYLSFQGKPIEGVELLKDADGIEVLVFNTK